jgi:hypothetical protein
MPDRHSMKPQATLPSKTCRFILRLPPCHYTKRPCTVKNTLSSVRFADLGQLIGHEVVLSPGIGITRQAHER